MWNGIDTCNLLPGCLSFSHCRRIWRGTLLGHFCRVLKEHSWWCTHQNYRSQPRAGNSAGTRATDLVVQEHVELGLWSRGVRLRHWTGRMYDETKVVPNATWCCGMSSRHVGKILFYCGLRPGRTLTGNDFHRKWNKF